MIVETATDKAMISEEILNDDPDFQSNSNLTIPNATQCHPDDLDLTDENFIAVCKEYMKTIKITEDSFISFIFICHIYTKSKYIYRNLVKSVTEE